MKDKEQINTISLLQILKNGRLDSSRGQFYNDECFVVGGIRAQEVKEGSKLFHSPTRLDCFIFVVNAEGEIKINYNLQEVTIGPRTAFFAAPNSILQTISTTGSGKSVVMFNENFMRKINLSIQNLLPHLTSLHQLDTLPLTEAQHSYLQHHISLVAESIAQPSAFAYYHEVVHDSIRAMVYTFISMLIQHLEKTSRRLGEPVHNHEEELFRRFAKLVGQHYRTDRRIAFYAELMHLTPKDMSGVIRHVSGHSPAEWITQNVLLEAKNLLRHSDMNIQEVSIALNFPNQSFFGRWFKEHTGLSPKAYREHK